MGRLSKVNPISYPLFTYESTTNMIFFVTKLFSKSGLPMMMLASKPTILHYVCRDLSTNVNRSDYSLALEKLHLGMAGNDEALFTTLTSRYSKKKGIN